MALRDAWYGIPFVWLFCQVQLSYFSIPLCQIAKSTLLFGYFAKSTLLVCQLHFAKLLCSHCHVLRVPKPPTPHCHWAIGLFLPCCPHHIGDCQMSVKPNMRAVVWGRSFGRLEKKIRLRTAQKF